MGITLLVVLAVLSVLHWYWTEQQGAGNLNFYIVMQFYSILLIVWISLRLHRAIAAETMSIR